MKISAPYFLYNQEFWNIQFPWKKCWVNPNHQNSCTNEKDCYIVFRLKSYSDHIYIYLQCKYSYSHETCLLGTLPVWPEQRWQRWRRCLQRPTVWNSNTIPTSNPICKVETFKEWHDHHIITNFCVPNEPRSRLVCPFLQCTRTFSKKPPKKTPTREARGYIKVLRIVEFPAFIK